MLSVIIRRMLKFTVVNKRGIIYSLILRAYSLLGFDEGLLRHLNPHLFAKRDSHGQSLTSAFQLAHEAVRD